MDNERSLTAARLEELAVWAEKNSEWCGRHGMTDVNANLADLARCAREYGSQLWRREGPRWMKCPTCKKDGFCRLDVWEPFNRTSKCKCRKCGQWAIIDQWTALEAVEAAAVKP